MLTVRADVLLIGQEFCVVLLMPFPVVRLPLEPGVVGFQRAESRQEVEPFLLQCVDHDALWRTDQGRNRLGAGQDFGSRKMTLLWRVRT